MSGAVEINAMVVGMYSEKHEHMTPAQKAAQDDRLEDDLRHGSFEATRHANLPLSDFMIRLMSEELSMLDSVSRQRVYDVLHAYQGPEITTQEELPEEIIALMDLQ